MQTGWWLSHSSEKYKVNGKDDNPYIMEKQKMFQTTNQYVKMQSCAGKIVIRWPNDSNAPVLLHLKMDLVKGNLQSLDDNPQYIAEYSHVSPPAIITTRYLLIKS